MGQSVAAIGQGSIMHIFSEASEPHLYILYLQLRLTFLWYLDNDLTPCISCTERLQGRRNALQAHVLFVRVTRASELSTLHKIVQSLPYFWDGFPLKHIVRTPM